MELILTPLPESLRHFSGKPIPAWMRMLHPDAAKSIVAIDAEFGGLVYNDVWRSADVSLWALRQKSGVQPPGFSAHNYGLAIDFSVEDTLKLRGWTYPVFRELLEQRGWMCHRRDGARGSEDWHFNYLGASPARYMAWALPNNPRTWALPVETRMVELYGAQMKLDLTQMQALLRRLHLYAGDLDGAFGPLSREATGAFQRAWGLPDTGEPDARTQRTLAFVTARKHVTAPVPVP